MLATFWLIVYSNHPNRAYVYKEPISTILQFKDEAACKASAPYQALRKTKVCVEVKSADCYNGGSVCWFDPVDVIGRDLLPTLVKPPGTN